jgi:hypothetical protein
VDKDRPHAPEHNEARERRDREAHDDHREVRAELRDDAVERVLSVSGEPVEVLGAVVHGVEAPQPVERVARAVEPVHQEVAEDDRQDDLKPHREPRERGARPRGDEGVEQALSARQDGERDAAPEQVLPKEEAEVHGERGPKGALPGSGREDALQRHEHEGEHGEARDRGVGSVEHQRALPAGAFCWAGTFGGAVAFGGAGAFGGAAVVCGAGAFGGAAVVCGAAVACGAAVG